MGASFGLFIQAVFGFASVGTGWYAFGVFVARLAIVALAAKAFAPKTSLPDSARQKLITVRDPIFPQRYVYGEDMLSGPLFIAGSRGNDNKDLYMGVVLTGHEIDSFIKYRIDDEDVLSSDMDAFPVGNVNNGKFDGVAEIRGHEGSSTQNVDSALDTAFGGLWGANHTGRGWSYVVFKFSIIKKNNAFEAGAPANLKAVVRGKMIYDPRLDSTNGGSGPHRLATPATWEWSDNPALILADFIRDDKVGMQEDDARIDWPMIITAADICDETVVIPPAASPSNTQKRYTCNYTFMADERRQNVLDTILGSMLGRIVFSQGKWRVWAGKAVTPDVTLTEANLAGEIQCQASAGAKERYNRVRGKFIDPEREYQAQSFPDQRSTTYENEDGGEVRSITVDYPATNSNFMAQRLALITLKQSRQQRVVTFQGNFSCFRIQPGSTVLLTIDEYGFSGEKFFVTEWAIDENGVKLTMIEEIDSSWNDPAIGEYTERSATGALVFGNTGVPAPTSLAAASFLGGVRVTWTDPEEGTFQHIEIWASDDNVRGNATLIGTSPGTQFIEYLADLNRRARYYWIRAVDKFGIASAWEPDLTTTTAIAEPGDPNTNFLADAEFDLSTSIPNDLWDTTIIQGVSPVQTGSVSLSSGTGFNGSNTVDFVPSLGSNSRMTLIANKASVLKNKDARFLASIRYKTVGSSDAADHEGFYFGVRHWYTGSTFWVEQETGPLTLTRKTSDWEEYSTVISFSNWTDLDPLEIVEFAIKLRGAAGTADTLRVDSLQILHLGNTFGVAMEGTSVSEGLVPKAPAADAAKFLKGDGTWATPSGTGPGVPTGTTEGAMLVWDTTASPDAWIEDTGIRWTDNNELVLYDTGISDYLQITVGATDVDFTMGSDASPVTPPIRYKFQDAPLFFEERAAAEVDVAAYGQLWVKNDVPNTLWFTDDAGTDKQLGALADGATTDSVLRWSGSAWIEEPQIQVTAGGQLKIGDAPLTDIVGIQNDATWLAFTEEAGSNSGIDLRDGMSLQVRDSTDTATFQMRTTLTEGRLDTNLGNGIEIRPNGTLTATFQELRTELEVPPFLAERASALTDQPAYGQIWVKNDVPNTLWFTDDAGNDVQLGIGQVADGTTTDAVIRWSGSAWVEETSIQISSSGVLGILNSAGTEEVSISNDGTDIVIAEVTGSNSGISLRDGMQIETMDSTDSASMLMRTTLTEGRIETNLGNGIEIRPNGTLVATFQTGRCEFEIPPFLAERATATTDWPGYGQIWVKNDTPNTLWFTDDAGGDFQLGAGITPPIDLLDNEELRFGTGQDILMDWDGTDFEVRAAAASPNINFRDGATVRVFDTTDVDSIDISTSVTVGDIRVTAGNDFTLGTAGNNGITIKSAGATWLGYSTTDEVLRTQPYNGADNITGAELRHWDGNFYDIGLARMPKVNFTTNTTVSDTHWHKRLVHNGTADATLQLTFNTEASQPQDVVLWVMAKNGPVTLIDGTMVLNFYDGLGLAPPTGNITVARGGWATVVKDGDSNAEVTGVGLS
jgi:hypothetical protein